MQVFAHAVFDVVVDDVIEIFFREAIMLRQYLVDNLIFEGWYQSESPMEGM